LYFHKEEVAAVDWLRESTDSTDTVLASYRIDRYIPARAGNRVFMGHAHETVDVKNKRQLAESFFHLATSDISRQDLLAGYGISYVFYGPTERRLGGFDPSKVAYLVPAYNYSSVTIYRVTL